MSLWRYCHLYLQNTESMLNLLIILLTILTPQEIERRTAIDFNKKLSDLMPYIQKYYPDVDSTQIAKWEESKALEYRIINGEKWYFRRAAENLFRIDPEARALKISQEGKERAGRDTVVMNHIRAIFAEQKEKPDADLYARHEWEFDYKLYFTPKAKLTNGELIKVWLPLPQTEHKRQVDVRITDSNRDVELHQGTHSTAYMEGQYSTKDTTMFAVKYEFATYAEYNALPRRFKHVKADKNNPELQKYLEERAPHCLFTDKVKSLADSIVGKEKRPYYQAKKMFAAIRKLYPWAGACEYGIIDNIPEYVIENRHGDCGQVTLLYIAMCRYKGIPARWQSGFMLHPGYDNLHDWCEIYIEGMGWIPVDPSFGVQSWGKTDAERYFYFGGMDAYRLIINTDWGAKLEPKKQFERSEPVDFQRGECETETENLYFDKWKYKFTVNLKN